MMQRKAKDVAVQQFHLITTAYRDTGAKDALDKELGRDGAPLPGCATCGPIVADEHQLLTLGVAEGDGRTVTMPVKWGIMIRHP
jgi:hypothetical protein